MEVTDTQTSHNSNFISIYYLDFHGSVTLNPTPPSPLSLSLVYGRMLEKTMKYSSALFQDKLQNHSSGKRERCMKVGTAMVPFVLTSLCIASIFSFYFLNSPNPLILVLNQGPQILENRSQKQEQQHAQTTKVSSSKPHRGKFQGDHISHTPPSSEFSFAGFITINQNNLYIWFLCFFFFFSRTKNM